MIMAEDKWKMWADLSKKMSEKQSKEEILTNLADSSLELSQWCIRQATGFGEKKPDIMSLFKYMAEVTTFMMVVSEKYKDHDVIQNAIEKNVINCFMDEYK